MNWWLVIWLSAGAYLLKVLGLVVLGGRKLPATVNRCLVLIPAALLAALIMKDTLTTGQEIVVDARLAGVSVAAAATLRRLPMTAVLVLGVGTTALVRGVAGWL
ncbi:MAG: AzlD domain-containing protein [Actinomycetota bacterium]